MATICNVSQLILLAVVVLLPLLLFAFHREAGAVILALVADAKVGLQNGIERLQTKFQSTLLALASFGRAVVSVKRRLALWAKRREDAAEIRRKRVQAAERRKRREIARGRKSLRRQSG